VLLGALLCASTASGQYFGRNKVHYKELDFKVLQTDHFDIYFYPEEREGIDIAARFAERWHARLERLLEHQLRGRQPLILYASHVDFEQTNVIGGELGEGTGGVTEPLRRRIVLPLGGPLADTDHVIGHELVHAFQFDITTRPGGSPGQTGIERLPLWFVEGMAEYLSLGPVDPNTAMWLRDAARREKLPSIDDLASPEYFPYRWGQAFWAYVGGKWGDAVIGQMLRIAAAADDPAVAIQKVLNLTTKELSEEWHQAIRSEYQPVLAATTPPADTGRTVLRHGGLGGDVNIGPAISPDGRWIAFLSERSLFSIDLFIAETSTGRVVHKLTSTASDPHYSSIEFIYSAGGWDAESRRLAVAAVANGRPALAIFDAASGDKEREISIPGVDEIFNPTWSPDGRAIGFTGMSRGLTDLYVIDLATSELRALTRDAFADLQPTWSPDGRRIAFATDRFTSRLDTLAIGPYRIGLIDVQTGAIEQVRSATAAHVLTPQWSADGAALYFVADPDGIPNLYRAPVAGGDVVQLTNVSTGLSGITSTSPALSVAAKANVAAFSIYDEGNYNISTLPLDTAAGSRAAPGELRTNAAALPPASRRPSAVASLLGDETFGLPPANAAPEVLDYRPSLALEALGQPTIAVGADRYGAAIGGGISFYFSDMLSNHNLGAALQFNSGLDSNFSIKNTAAQAAYTNQTRRWNWGLVGGQIPYLSGGISRDVAIVDGVTSVIDQTIIFRQTERSAAGMVAYPFNRAQRVEFQAGVSQVSFDQITRTQAFVASTGELFFDETQESSIGDPLSLATSSAALVYDTSSFGATSPVQGQRYRLEASPTFGTLNFTGLLADYRRYFMPAPFYTIAGRVIHYGRYGSGSEDSRLFPLFIGYPTMVRGYDVYTFDPDECVATATSECPAFDRLLGSRVLVANLEFRFPLLRPFGASRNPYGPVPAEVAFFADAGVAWDSGDKPTFFGGDRKGVSSVGAALRLNLFGFMVGQFDFSRPLQRPGKGWIFQFTLGPGF
jgi:hypothetical protein